MKQKQKYMLPCVLFIISSIFYLLFFFYDGIILTEDANSYIVMEANREPGYCSFLWLCRSLFGVDAYLHIAVIIQCLIAGAAASAVAIVFRKRFHLNLIVTMCILFIQYGITLLNRFVAQRRYSYYNSIETEALSYSLWIFFMLAIMHVIYDKRKRDILIALVWAVLLITIRKQMYVTLGVLFIAVFYALWQKEKKVKSIGIALLVIAVGFAGNKMIDKTYNFATRGVFEEHTGDANFIFGTEVYMADESYVKYISKDENREIFQKILVLAKEKQYNQIYAENTFLGLEEHYSLSYDRIKFDIVNMVVREYEDSLGIPEEEREAFSSKLIGEMAKELIIPAFPSMWRLFWQNVIHGLIITIAMKRNVITGIGTIVLYTVYIALICYLSKKKGENRKNSLLPMAVITLLAILGNIALTSATIYCQARYMLYNTALFYQIGLLLLLESVSICKQRS